MRGALGRGTRGVGKVDRDRDLVTMTARATSSQVVVPLQSLLATMSDGVLITDEHGFRTYANPALADLVGDDPCQPAGDRSAPAWIAPSQAARFDEYVRLARNGSVSHEIISLDWRIVAANGREVPALVKVIPMQGLGRGPIPLMWLIVPDRTPTSASGGRSNHADLEESMRRIAAEVDRAGYGTSPSGAASTVTPLPELKRLSPREREVLEHLLRGHRVSSISRELDVSEHTVRNHLKSMFRKLAVHSQADLVRLVRTGERAD